VKAQPALSGNPPRPSGVPHEHRQYPEHLRLLQVQQLSVRRMPLLRLQELQVPGMRW